jgi:hypothetical protein
MLAIAMIFTASCTIDTRDTGKNFRNDYIDHSQMILLGREGSAK